MTNQQKLIIVDKNEQKQRTLLRRLNSPEGKFAERITSFSGSMDFVYVHAIWFIIWIGINHGFFMPFIPIFDPFPYGLLTMIVSLEAIFLSAFIMVAQNRQSLMDKYRDLEEEIDEHEEEKEQQELEEDVEDLQENVEDIQGDMDTIQKDLDVIMSSITALQQKLSTTIDKSKNQTEKTISDHSENNA
jgi:uncharacterized membrane protein